MDKLSATARSILNRIRDVAHIEGGNVRPCKVPGLPDPASLRAAGFYGGSPGAYWSPGSMRTVTAILGAPYASVTGVGAGIIRPPYATVVGVGTDYFDEPLESSDPKIVDSLSNKDWWDLGKEIIKD